jgi:cholesterol oxidase
MISRRRFAKNSLAAAVSLGILPARASTGRAAKYVEAVVIGSGFGGAVAALRLGLHGIETVVIERGRRWRIKDTGDTFCTKESPDGRSTWLSNTTILPPPVPNLPIDVFTGVFDRKVGTGMTAFFGAGVGGSSLVYGGATYQPPEELFYKSFPKSISYKELDRVYFPRVRKMLNATPIPDDVLEADAYLSSRILLKEAAAAGLKTVKPPMAIDWDIVRREIKGKKAPSIINGEVFYGTSSGAKNSLDHNYLRQAEETGSVEIRPLHVVTSIEEADRGRYRVVCNHINEQGAVLAEKTFECRYLFLAAGSIGTSELLLRAQSHGTLRNLNHAVGKFWSPSAESLSILSFTSDTNPTLGSPCVVSIEDFANPIAPITIQPFQAIPAIPQGLTPLLGQGISQPNGYLTYNTKTQSADLFWPTNTEDDQKNAQAMQHTLDRIDKANGTSVISPADFSFTAHPVGGAVMNQACSEYGEVFGHNNLFVVDGSLIPGSTAAVNPSLTIAALAERSMEHFLDNGRPRHESGNGRDAATAD